MTEKQERWKVLRSRYIPALWPFLIYWKWDMEGELGIDSVVEFHVWKEGLTWAIWSIESLRELGKKTVEILEKTDLDKLRKKGLEAGEKCLKYVKEFSKKDHTAEQYLEFFKKFTKLHVEIMRNNMVYWVFAGKSLEMRVQKEMQNKDVIQVMSMPLEESYSKKEEKEFYDLVSLSKKKGFDGETKDKIKEFVNKYYWFPYEYVGPEIWTEEIITNRIKESIESKEKVREENIEQKQEELVKKHNISEETQKYFKLLRFCSLLQDDRKMYNSHICYYVNEVIMRKMSKTLDITFEKARIVEEKILQDYIDKKDHEAFDKELDERLKFLVVGRKRKGDDFLFSGEEGKKLLEKENIKLPIAEKGVSEVKGNIAYKGNAKGIARVLHSSQTDNFNEGDIIITGMTTPDFVPLIKKAGAIVTDEGGITCHASIVAREMQKPCVIGTKIATQVFKDGDMVEVDAEKGIVKRLK